MIIEDDVEFENSFFEKLDKVWLDDYDMMFLNGTHGVWRKPKDFNKDWFKVDELYGAFGYIVNSRFYDIIIDWLEREERPSDVIYSMFMSFFKVYKLKKPLIFHRPGMSDIMGVIPKNYKHLERGRV